jgi:hypothetical protein
VYRSITLIVAAQNGVSDEIQLGGVYIRSEGNALIQSLIGTTVELAIVENNMAYKSEADDDALGIVADVAKALPNGGVRDDCGYEQL